MNTSKGNLNMIIGDGPNSSYASFLENCSSPKDLEENQEHKEIPVVESDQDCAIEDCKFDHKTLACLLSSEMKRFNCNEGYQDHKDDSSEDNPHNASRIEGSTTYTNRLSNCDSISSSRRSFGFPILRSEWPDHSPVRMVEVDRKHRQRWRISFLCFKF